MYLILLVLGLGIGAVFLAVLLTGDRKEARLAAQRKAVQEQIAQARELVEGSWPPPPSVPVLPPSMPPATSAHPSAARAANRKMVRNFFLARNYAAAALVLAYIVYSCFPRFNFVWVLLATAGAMLAVWGVLTLWKRRVRD